MIKDSGKPIVIAGPCSLESEEQLYKIVTSFNNSRVNIIRAGIWKPRTTPNSFEGIGEEGLKWIKNLKKEFDFKIAVEVGTPRHVELALKYEIDVLWIGARTTVSPFSINDIADSVKGVNIPILIKNPINPDMALWIGAVERFRNAGIRDIMAIHRGFSVNYKNKYRNLPLWSIPLRFKAQFPEIPMICDPSHISGDRKLIYEIAKKSIDLNYDGLMIEVHPNPQEALSDANQQLTPDDFLELIASLDIDKERRENTENMSRIEQIRNEIYELDNEIAVAMEERRLLENLI